MYYMYNLLLLEADKITLPDWAVHLIALLIMGLIAGYVRLLVKGVDVRLQDIKVEVSSLRQFGHWVNDSIMTIAAKANIKLPPK